MTKDFINKKKLSQIAIIFLGKPGSGKGTQIEMLTKKNPSKYYVIQISNLIKNSIKSKDNTEIKKFLENGLLVPDEIISKLIDNEIKKISIPKDKYIIFDGVCRTYQQVLDLEKILEKYEIKIKIVFEFDIPDYVAIKRLSGRIICERCEAIYNKYFKPPKIEGKCDECASENFLTRSDDKKNVVKYRLKLYEKDIKKIRDYYSAKGVFTTIDNTEFNINEIINYLE
jgi:adenylate kinase